MTAVGVDIGGTKMLTVRCDADGNVLEERVSPSPTDGRRLVAQVVEAVRALSGEVESVGVGVPGVVDETGTLVFAPNLQGAIGLRLEDELSAAIPGARAWVGNDANAAGWGEHRAGAGAGRDGLIMVTLGTGIGGAMVVGGKLREGAHGFAGEFGHMVVEHDGLLCTCGKRGCWERYASGGGLGMLGREISTAGGAPAVTKLAGGDPEAVKGEHVTAAAARGDQDAIDIMRRFGWWVALGLANLVAVLDPQIVVVGGGMVEAGEVLMSPVREALAELTAASEVRAPVPLVAAALGPHSGAIGAALLGRG